MNKKHYYFKSISDWTSTDNKEHKKILFYCYGGLKRGKLEFKFFDNEKQARTYAQNLNMIGA